MRSRHPPVAAYQVSASSLAYTVRKSDPQLRTDMDPARLASLRIRLQWSPAGSREFPTGLFVPAEESGETLRISAASQVRQTGFRNVRGQFYPCSWVQLRLNFGVGLV